MAPQRNPGGELAGTTDMAKTIKGYTLGPTFEARNATHQMKKLALDDLKGFRDQLRG